jgi:hypothetical protein
LSIHMLELRWGTRCPSRPPCVSTIASSSAHSPYRPNKSLRERLGPYKANAGNTLDFRSGIRFRVKCAFAPFSFTLPRSPHRSPQARARSRCQDPEPVRPQREIPRSAHHLYWTKIDVQTQTLAQAGQPVSGLLHQREANPISGRPPRRTTASVLRRVQVSFGSGSPVLASVAAPPIGISTNSNWC